MPVNVQNRILETVRGVVGDAVAVLNQAAKADAAATRNLTPVDTGLLRRSIRVKKATAGNMQASRSIGGAIEGDKPGSYVLPQNYGYATKSGGHVAGHFMHEAGIEEGINVLKNGVKEIARNVNSGRRGRAMTIQADTDEQVAEFLSEGF